MSPGRAAGPPEPPAATTAAWLYPMPPKPDAGHVEASQPDAPRHVPGSTASYTNQQVSDPFVAPDWHPQEHGPVPPIVAQGRRPAAFACGYCHRMTGSGGPENAHLAGLPATYIRQQFLDMRDGTRRSSHADRLAQAFMVAQAKAATDEEIDAAAAYFAAQPPTASFRVVESDTAPAVHFHNWALAADVPATRVPLGQRLLELPDDQQDFVSRDTHVRFTIYAPLGSVARGRVLASQAGATGCTACHGSRLEGQGVAPPLAGQAPSYLLRQLVDFASGARHGAQGAPMAAVASALSMDDMIAVAAYAASVVPSAAER